MFILDESDDDDDGASLDDEIEIWRFSPLANWALESTEPTVTEGIVILKKV